MNALIVSPHPVEKLKALAEKRFSDISVTASAYGARQIMVETQIDLLIVCAPLPDEFGDHLAAEAANTGMTQAILIAPPERCADMDTVYVIAKSPTKAEMAALLRYAAVACNRFVGLKRRIDKERMVTRAKLALMGQLGLSEPEAHKYIEKQAMDLRKTTLQIAEMVVKNYEN